MTLHEAMQMVLNDCPNKSATTDFISEEIAKRNLYRQKTGGVAHPAQIFLRARKYPHLFELIENKIIRLKTSLDESSKVSEPKLDYYQEQENIASPDIDVVLNYLKKKVRPFLQIENFSFQPGIYAVFFFGTQFPLKEATEYIKIRPIIYLGKTETSSHDRDLKQHFTSGQTGRSTLRRSLGALLREKLNLRPVPRNISENSERRFMNYKFDPDGEIKLTEWMRINLGLSFYPIENDMSRIRFLEKELIQKIVPVLNLRDNYHNIFYSLVENARNTCITLAK